MINRMILNQTSYFGAGAVASIVDEIKKRGFSKALVVTDKDLIKFHVADKVTSLLDKAGLAYEIFSDVKANPSVNVVKQGVAAFKAAGADYLIAIGGGSPTDTSKAIGIIINNPEFADVVSLEGCAACRDLQTVRTDHRDSDHGGNRGRGDDQLRHHRRGEETQIRLRRSARHPGHRGD